MSCGRKKLPEASKIPTHGLWGTAVSINNNATDESRIRELIGEWEAALAVKDAAAALKDYADDIVLYDVCEHANTRDAYQALWEKCFPYFGPSIAFERKDEQLRISGDLAVLCCLTRIHGAQSDSDSSKSWVRTTVCYERQGGDWRVVHEHVSLPMDAENERPAYILDS